MRAITRRGTTTALGLATVLLLAGCASAAAGTPEGAGAASVSAPTPTPTPTPVATPWAMPDPAEFGTGDAAKDMTLLSSEVVDGLLAVRDYAPTAHPDVYTDVASGTRGNPDVLRISLTELDPAVEADLLRVAGTTPEKVLFVKSSYSAAEATPVANTVTAHSQNLSIEGIQLTSWGMDVDGFVDIGIVGHDPAQIERLFALFGPGVRFTTDTLPARPAGGEFSAAPARG